MMDPESVRSQERIGTDDLLRLAELAEEVEARLFERNPTGAGRYAGRLLCRALCQGAALHYVDARNGVKDFDVWSFYAERDDGPFPYRWRGTADYGSSKFGRYPGDPPSYTGRRVDFLGRSLRASLYADPVVVVRDYLAARNTASAKELAAKAVVLIYPRELLGQVIWPEVSP
jgi:hypothetical protein